VVSFDFSTGIVPGWHATIFPPYFVAGAIYSGFAMVLTLAIPIRAYYGMEDFITMRHIQNCAKVMLCTGLIVLYGYSVEAFMGWFSGDPYEGFMIWNRMTGNYWYMYWFLIFCNGVMPQALWFKKVRTNIPLLFCIALVVNVGMWLERFVIVVTSLSRDFLPSAWGMYAGTMWDWMTYIGTLGLFTWLMFIFLRLLPMISMFEMRTIVPSAKIKSEGGH
jgi:molybdopterin-containing oxidoreductase family membrane subunit